jgi:hypothetical protein
MTSKKDGDLQELRVDVLTHKPRPMNPMMETRNTDFVYVNSGYVGSINDVNNRFEQRLQNPPTRLVLSVIIR